SKRDWSSDVCSSDLLGSTNIPDTHVPILIQGDFALRHRQIDMLMIDQESAEYRTVRCAQHLLEAHPPGAALQIPEVRLPAFEFRSEERRVGNEGRSR